MAVKKNNRGPIGPYLPQRGTNYDVNPSDPDAYGNYYFALEIKDADGTTEVAHFMECSGLKSTAEVFEIQEGGLNGRTHKRTGQSKWDNLVLRYATSASSYMLRWRDAYLQDQFTDDIRRKYSGAISLKNNHGDVVKRWEFTNAWPVSWEGPSLASGGSELAIESIEIAHDGLKVGNIAAQL